MIKDSKDGWNKVNNLVFPVFYKGGVEIERNEFEKLILSCIILFLSRLALLFFLSCRVTDRKVFLHFFV